MQKKDDYYEILGVIPSVETVVIKAAYKALISVYHPDRYQGDESEKIIKLINKAYSVLSDLEKRKKYDRSRDNISSKVSSSLFEENLPFDSEPLDREWKIAQEFYPEIKKINESIAKISWRLAFAFRIELLESKDFDNAKKISESIQFKYLSKYFGEDQEILSYAKFLIVNKEISAAIRLNSIVKVMGNSISIGDVEKKINEEYDIKIRRYNIDSSLARQLYYRIGKSRWLNYNAAFNFIKLHNGSIKEDVYLFSVKLTLKIDECVYKFKSKDELCIFIIKKYSSFYK